MKTLTKSISVDKIIQSIDSIKTCAYKAKKNAKKKKKKKKENKIKNR